MFKKISTKKCRSLLQITLFLSIGLCSFLDAKLKVVTTSADLASIARFIGEDLVEVQSLAQGSDDLHYLAARPDFILKTSKADVFIQIGMELEIGWAPLVVENSRNLKIHKGNSGFCDTSSAIVAKNVPKGELNRSMGDVHPQGNPHYWNDPMNGIRIGEKITVCLSKNDPGNSARYSQNFQKFSSLLKTKLIQWSKRLQKLSGKKVITYHDEFVYFLDRFRIQEAGHIEAIPGVAPGTARIRELVELIRREKIRLIIVSPWSNIGLAQKIGSESGAKTVVLPTQTGAVRSVESYIEMIENCVAILEKNLN